MAYSAAHIFGGHIINLNDDKAQFSYGWAGASIKDEHTPSLFFKLAQASGVKEFMDYVDDVAKDGYNGMGVNLVLGDNSGDIGYLMLSSLPVRKDQTPYIGCRILDGTKSTYDWVENVNVKATDLPRSFNPEKGYIVTANNRQTSDYAKQDYGATVMATARSIRITEMI